jgi:hypothetical protein
VRSLERTNEGSPKNNDFVPLLNQARESGALASHSRATKRRIAQIKAQQEYLARAAGERLITQAVEAVEAGSSQ